MSLLVFGWGPLRPRFTRLFGCGFSRRSGGEKSTIILETPADIEEQIRTGVIWDGMTIAGWSIAKGRM
jgi:hypothetical protein